MIADDAPRPDIDAPADAADAAYQAGYAEASGGFRAIRAALSFLAAELDTDGWDPLSLATLRDTRVEALRAIARTFRAVAPDRD
jgi:hypothetical protein